MSMLMPMSVLMALSMSAPASITRRAPSAMSVWLGESLTISGLDVAARHTSVTRAAISGSLPKAAPPFFTLGQEMFTSMAATGVSSKRRVTSAYSSSVLPETLAM